MRHIYCSDKSTFLQKIHLKFVSSLLHIRYKVFHIRFKICCLPDHFLKMRFNRFGKFSTSFSSYRIGFRSKLIHFKMKRNLEAIPYRWMTNDPMQYIALIYLMFLTYTDFDILCSLYVVWLFECFTTLIYLFHEFLGWLQHSLFRDWGKTFIKQF